MRSFSVLLLSAVFTMGSLWAQDDAKADAEKKKQEEKQQEEAAKTAIAKYKAERAKAKNTGDIAAAIDNNLGEADAHPLIRALLAGLLADPNVDVRGAAIDALGNKKWKGDKECAKILIGAAGSQKDADTKVKCIRRFGNIAPYSQSTSLKNWMRNENNDIAAEAIDSVKEINSMRMMEDLINMLGDLDAIKKDAKPKDSGSYGPPPPGVPAGGPSASANDEKVKRKDTLTPKVLSAINTLWKKYDDTLKTNTYVEVTKAWSKNKAFVKKVIDQEDKEEKGIDPEDEKDKDKDKEKKDK